MDLRAKYLDLCKAKIEEVEIDGEKYHIKALSAGERIQMEDAVKDFDLESGLVNLGLAYLCHTWCHENGKAVWSYPDDLPTLQSFASKVTVKLMMVSNDINLFWNDDQTKKKSSVKP